MNKTQGPSGLLLPQTRKTGALWGPRTRAVVNTRARWRPSGWQFWFGECKRRQPTRYFDRRKFQNRNWHAP